MLVFLLSPARIVAFGRRGSSSQDTVPSTRTNSGQVVNSNARLRALFQEAAEAQSRSDFRAAAARYQEILKLDPNLAGARMNLGLMFHLLGEYHQAVGNFERVLRESPDLLGANLFLGIDLLKLRQPRRALRYLKTVEQSDPHNELAARSLAQAYTDLRQFQPANHWYFLAVEKNPKDPEALYGLGITYLDLERSAASELGSKGQDSPYSKRLLAEFFEDEGRVNDAIGLYKTLIQKNTNWPGLRTALGFDYVHQGQVGEAKGEFQAELAQNPGYLLARLGLARTFLEQGALDQCTRELQNTWTVDRVFFRANFEVLLSGLSSEKAGNLERALRDRLFGSIDPDLRNYLSSRLQKIREPLGSPISGGNLQTIGQTVLRGKASPWVLYQQGRYSSCTQTLKREDRLDRPLMLLMAKCSFYAGDYRASFLAAGQALTAKPDSYEAMYWRAISASKLTVETLLEANRADPNSFWSHLLLGRAYRMKQKYKASESEYRKALDLKPKDPAAHLGLATLFWQEKEYDKALPEIQATLLARPNDPEASYLMADILVARHQYSQARPYLTAALGAFGRTIYFVHALRGEVFASDGQVDEAIKEFQSALPGDSDGSFHFQLYRLYAKTGNQKAAAAALRGSQAIRRRSEENLQQAFERSD